MRCKTEIKKEFKLGPFLSKIQPTGNSCCLGHAPKGSLHTAICDMGQYWTFKLLVQKASFCFVITKSN